MMYSIIKPFAKIALKVYFRKINISHREHIPIGKPVVLALNHPTAFTEPCIIACWLGPSLNFIARGDLYVKSRFVRRLYDWFHIVPVFRIDDLGYGGLKSNYETFDKCHQALLQNKIVLIMAEGRCIHEKRLRPLRKGTAKVVFGAAERFEGLDIQVVPVGVNYSNPDKFRSEVKIDFGEPIRVQDYMEAYRSSPPKAIHQFTSELRRRLYERVVHLDHPADDTWTEPLLELHRNNRPFQLFRGFSTDPAPLFAEKKFAEGLNALPPERRDALREKTGAYLQALKEAKVSDLGLADELTYSTWSGLLLGVGWLPYLLGLVLNLPPVLGGMAIAKKIVKTIEFRASVLIFVTMALYMLYWFGWLVAAAILGRPWLWVLALLLPVLGYFAVLYRDLDQMWKEDRNVQRLEEATEERLLQMRQELQHLAHG